MRGRLIAEAEMLVKRRGYSGFSYADLAAVIGISKASIHHHFPAKEDLGAALIGTYKERYDAALQAIWAESASGSGGSQPMQGFILMGSDKIRGVFAA